MMTDTDSAQRAERRIGFLTIALLTMMTGFMFLAGLCEPLFTTDSWSYLELSNTVFGDFYRYNTLRQFEFHSPYGNSFPPLWPVLIALVRRVADIGIYAGYALNFVVCIALLLALVRLARRLAMPGAVGGLAYAGLWSFPGFADEVLAARSIPLSTLLLVLTLGRLFGPNLRWADAAWAGLFMGLNCLTRYDALLVAPAVAVVIAWRTYSDVRNLVAAVGPPVVYGTVFLAVLSPWIAYGMYRFQTPLATDNSRQVYVAHKARVSEYYRQAPESDLVRRPGLWLRGLATQKAPLVVNSGIAGVLGSCLPMLLAIVVTLWSRSPVRPVELKQFARLSLLLIPLLLLPSLLSGYGRERYFIASFLLVQVQLLGEIHARSAELWSSSRALVLMVIVAAVPLYMFGVKPVYHIGVRNLSSHLAPLRPTADMQAITDAVQRDAAGGAHRLLQLVAVDATMYGAVTGEPTAMMPNLVDGKLADFVHDWEVTHVYDPENKLAEPEADLTGLSLVPLDLPGLFRFRLGR